MAELSLDELYQKTIDEQRNHLFGLQDQFNKKCDDIRKIAQDKLTKVPDENREGKEAVLMEQKAALEEGLRWLKEEVNTSTRQTMKKLEEIQTQREQKILAELEQQMAALST